jgi:putative membrane protein
MMHWGNFGGMGFGGFGLGWIFMVVFWVLVIVGIVYLVKYIVSGDRAEIRRETAEDILRKRYASGEISKNEFDEKMKVLMQRNLR